MYLNKKFRIMIMFPNFLNLNINKNVARIFINSDSIIIRYDFSKNNISMVWKTLPVLGTISNLFYYLVHLCVNVLLATFAVI